MRNCPRSAIGFLLLILMPCAGAGRLEAANRLYIDDLAAKVGQTGVTIPVKADTDQVRHGFSLSIKYDQTKLSVTGITTAGTAAATAEWTNGRILAAKGAISWGVVMDFSEPLTNVIPVGNGQVVAMITADVLAAAPTTASVAPQNGLDEPPGGWINLFSFQGVNTLPELDGASITIEPAVVEGNRFKLGDCNGDITNIDLSDAIFLLNYQFVGGQRPGCLAACDTNSDGGSDLSDAIYLLTHLFLGGPAPRPPFPECDQAPAADCATAICAA